MVSKRPLAVRDLHSCSRLAKSVANLGALLLARVQVEMEEQNAAILKSLNARADSQVKIQHAVEAYRSSRLPTTCSAFSKCRTWDYTF
jgi:uncharacterized membrane-anchored protein